MTYPLDMYQLTWQFKLSRVGTAEDIAEFSLWFQTINGAQYGPDELPHAAQGGWNAWVAHAEPANHTAGVALESVFATSYQADGKIFDQENFVAGTPWAGTSTQSSMPWETALAVSLYTYPRGTFVQHGRRKRGRFYLPVMSVATLDGSDSGYFANASLPGTLDRMVAFCGAAEESDLGAKIGTLSVFSRVDSMLRAVTQISIDAKFDSQRRRQNREVAGYLVENFTS